MLQEAPISLYPYDPVVPLPIVFAALVFILGSVLFWQSWRYSWWHFSYAMTFASVVWVGGFAARTYSVLNTHSIPGYLAQYVLIFAGPPLFAASETFILGRLLQYLPYHTPMHPGRVLTTFLLVSSVIEALGASGAAVMGSANASQASINSALSRLEASLILQIVVEAGFMSLVGLVEYRCRKARHFPKNVRVVTRVLYITSIMMVVRCVFRVVEGFESAECISSHTGNILNCGTVHTNEWFLWVFEVANIAFFVLLLAIFHPGRFLPSDKAQYLDPVDGTTERVGPGWSASTSQTWYMSILDPFDWMGSMSGGKKVDKFWERDNPIAEKSFAATGVQKRSRGSEDIESSA